MTAHALARMLLNGPDLPVHQSYNYGDYWKTQAAPEIRNVETGIVEDSASIGMPRAIDEDHIEKYGKEDDAREVILLN